MFRFYFSGVFGKLMEVNENLLKDPTLINKMVCTFHCCTQKIKFSFKFSMEDFFSKREIKCEIKSARVSQSKTRTINQPKLFLMIVFNDSHSYSSIHGIFFLGNYDFYQEYTSLLFMKILSITVR